MRGIGVMSGALVIAIAAGYAIRTYPGAVTGAQVALLCFAVLGLPRAERPPFVMSGMLATALALACLPALALNRRAA
jgi:hypothetical protein